MSEAVAQLPGLELLETIGQGANSIVYRARRGERTFAVKLLRLSASAPRAALALRFRREAAALARLQHPCLPGIFDLGELQQRPYLVMDDVEGWPLASALGSRPLSEQRVITIGKALADVLAQLHRHGLFQRDIRPGKIVLDQQGGIKLLDFELAHKAVAGDSDRGMESLRYCAPEQTGALQRPIDGRADLYALGGVLFHCLCGRPPFTALDPDELLLQHAIIPAPAVRELSPASSQALAALIAKLLAKDPDERYQSGQQLLADLSRLEELDASAERGELLLLGGGAEHNTRAQHPPLVGRETELVRLLELWHRARSEQGAVVLLQGEAGSGKSRLIDELASRALEVKALVLAGRASRADRRPFAALSHSLDSYIQHLHRLPAQQRRSSEDQLRAAAGEIGPLLAPLSPQLAALFGSSGKLPEPSGAYDHFYDAIAAFLLRLGEMYPATLLVMDDIQWVDDASWQVVRRLVSQVNDTRILVLVSGYAEPQRAEALEKQLAGAQTGHPICVQLGPLAEEGVAQLVSTTLGGYELQREFISGLTARSNGNPLAVLEYVRAILDAGLLRPFWGSWIIPSEHAGGLNFPADVLSLLARRIEKLDDQTREIITAAALLGSPFRFDLLPAICNVEQQTVCSALNEAAMARLVEPAAAGTYRFVHDRLAEALHGRLAPHGVRALHQRIAEVLDAEGAQERSAIYSLARHYALGEHSITLQRMYETNLAAGMQALESYADEEAYAFLERAYCTAQRAGSPPSLELERGLGEVCARTGRYAEAIVHLQQALEYTSEPLGRAQLHLRTARLYAASSESAMAWAQVELGLSELGVRYPKARLLQLLSLLWHGIICLCARLRRPVAAERQREWQRTLAELYECGGYIGYFSLRPLLLLQMSVRQMASAPPIGPSQELASAYASTAVISAMLRQARVSDRCIHRAIELGEQLKNPRLVAYGAMLRAIAQHMLGYPQQAEQLSRQCEEQYGRWLDTRNYIYLCSEAMLNLLLRGYCKEAWRWAEIALHRLNSVRSEQGSLDGYTLNAYAGAVLTILGKQHEAQARLQRFREEVAKIPGDRYRRADLYACEMLIHLELREIGLPLEKTIERFKELGLRPELTPYHLRQFYLFQAYGRLAQYIKADEEARSVRLRQLGDAVKQLRRAARGHKLLACHLRIIQATLRRMDGRYQQATGLLDQARYIADEIDSPWACYEIARQRALLLAARGAQHAALREAQFAHGLAIQHGWLHRARQIWAEFQLGQAERAPAPRQAAPSSAANTDTYSLKIRRYLDALLQVTLATGTIIDPRRQAQAALDEIVRILGAERAFLFRSQAESDELSLEVARDADGSNLHQENGYSSALVEKVQLSQQPLVQTSADEGAMPTPQSSVSHELRSIIAAPLLMGNRLVGIIYLDNRLANGVFTSDDLKILRAIANQLAVSLENSRIAQLEVHIEAERRQRELAETMRSVIHVLNSSLDLREVLDRVLESLAHVVPYDSSSVILLNEEHYLRIVAARGLPDRAAARELCVQPDQDQLFSQILRTGRPLVIKDTREDPRFRGYAGTSFARSWLGTPLIWRGRTIGVLTVDSRTIGAYGEHEAEISFIFAGQAAIAIENARLFGEVQRLAVTDELTGLYNRRQFLAVAERELHRARRYERPLSLLMVDVDHFKSVNDSLGHPTGDQVLESIAKRCLRNLREIDILGRYGGEEFVVLLPETQLDDALLIAERLRSRVAGTPISTERGAVSVTISLGVAGAGEETEAITALIRQADTALYEAKALGRNCVALPGTAGEQHYAAPRRALRQKYRRRARRRTVDGRPLQARRDKGL